MVATARLEPLRPNGVNTQPDITVALPRAADGRARGVENRHTLQLLACPTCKDSVWVVSVNDRFEVHLECATCPPAPAVKLTVDHLRAAVMGTPPS